MQYMYRILLDPEKYNQLHSHLWLQITATEFMNWKNSDNQNT